MSQSTSPDRKSGIAIAALLVLSVALSPAMASLVLYDTRADFNLAHPFAPLEDFEAANLAPGDTATIESILDSTTSNAVFSPGDIVSGLQIVVAPSDSSNMFVSSAGFANYVSHAISYNSATPGEALITVNFLDEDVSAFALDVTSNPGGLTVTVSVYSFETLLDSFDVTGSGAGTFLGIGSTTDLITRLELTSESNFFGVDNVAFSSSTVIPAPAALAAGLALLSAAQLRRRKQAQVRAIDSTTLS